MIRLIGSAVVIYGLVVASLYLLQRRILFVPNPNVPERDTAGLSDMAEVRLETADGLALLSWYRPAEPGRPSVIYFQGNAGNIGHRGHTVRPMLDRGWGVLLVGYRGYGGNAGSPSEEGLHADAAAAAAFLVGEGVTPARTVYWGESLGSGVAVRLAAERPPGAVVLEAPYTSIVEMAASRYWFVPVRHLVKDRFDSLSRIAAIGAPLLVLHGAQDRVIPIEHGRRLFAAATEPKRFEMFPDGRHSDLVDHGALDVAERFLNEHMAQ